MVTKTKVTFVLTALFSLTILIGYAFSTRSTISQAQNNITFPDMSELASRKVAIGGASATYAAGDFYSDARDANLVVKGHITSISDSDIPFYTKRVELVVNKVLKGTTKNDIITVYYLQDSHSITDNEKHPFAIARAGYFSIGSDNENHYLLYGGERSVAMENKLGTHVDIVGSGEVKQSDFQKRLLENLSIPTSVEQGKTLGELLDEANVPDLK